MATLTEQLQKIAQRYDELAEQMAQPDVMADYTRLNELAQERNGLDELVVTFRRFQEVVGQLHDGHLLLDDPEMKELAELEIAELETERAQLEEQMRRLLIPKDPFDDKNAILEIRAGTGGDEAGLFAGELLRMYMRWAEDHKLKLELLSESDTGIGGIKEAFLAVKGEGAFGRLKYESGVHRVQRVPTT